MLIRSQESVALETESSRPLCTTWEAKQKGTKYGMKVIGSDLLAIQIPVTVC